MSYPGILVHGRVAKLLCNKALLRLHSFLETLAATYCRWVMYNQHQTALLELQQNNMHNQIDLKALSEPVDQVGD